MSGNLLPVATHGILNRRRSRERGASWLVYTPPSPSGRAPLLWWHTGHAPRGSPARLPKGPCMCLCGGRQGGVGGGADQFSSVWGAPGVAMWPPPGFVVQPLHAILNESRSSHEGRGERVEWGERAPCRSRVRGGAFSASGTCPSDRFRDQLLPSHRASPPLPNRGGVLREAQGGGGEPLYAVGATRELGGNFAKST